MKITFNSFFLVLIFLSALQFFNNSRINGQTGKRSIFVITEFYAGSIVPNYMNYPRSYPRVGMGATIYQVSSENTSVNRYYRHPYLGLHTSFHYLGAAQIFGNEINLLPVMAIPLKKGMIQIGIGASYFTKTYQDNTLNKAVGSNLTWCFQSFYFRNFSLESGNTLRLGFGFLHGSNGHTQLPNYGINSAVLSVGLYKKPDLPSIQDTASLKKVPKTFFTDINTGLGFHEFGGTTGPVNGAKALIYSTSVKAGIVFNNQFQLYTGLGFRHYQHFADSINKNVMLQEMDVTPNNLYFLLGIEYLVHHVGLSIEGGINLYKPFYIHFAKRFESQETIKFDLRRIFLTRMGLKFYLFNTSKKPKHNIYLAPYINANFSKADFSEITIGYVYNFKKN